MEQESSGNQVLQQYGKVEAFDVQTCVKYVESLLLADEVERALLVLDNVPAYYRVNVPVELRDLRRRILNAACTPASYMNDGHDQMVKPEGNAQTLKNIMRGQLLINEVATLNKKELAPKYLTTDPTSPETDSISTAWVAPGGTLTSPVVTPKIEVSLAMFLFSRTD